MNITLIPITVDYMPEKEGKYLVKVETIPMKNIHYLQANVKKTFVNGKWAYSIDVSNQVVTHISSEPLNMK